MFENRHNEKGFTLAEILVTLGLIGILAVSLFSVFRESSLKQRRLMHKVAALQFAQAGMESVFADKQMKGFDLVQENRYKIERYQGIKRKIEIESVTNDLKKIRVVVDWSDYSDSLVSYIGKY